MSDRETARMVRRFRAPVQSPRPMTPASEIPPRAPTLESIELEEWSDNTIRRELWKWGAGIFRKHIIVDMELWLRNREAAMHILRHGAS